jgi:NodT family efflux transporter outer membrane factor (OMF) lipoprotein
MNRIMRIAALVLASLVTACASIPTDRPAAAITNAASLAAEGTLASATVAADTWPATDWWRQFGDSQLDQLIREALAGSPTLRVATARTREALARAGVASAARFPQVNGSLTGTRERFSENGLLPPPFAGSWSTLSELDATLSWELDLWGKNRNIEASARDEAHATAIDADAARLALSTTIAHAYIQLERAYLQLDVAAATLSQRQEIFTLTRDRNLAGIDSRLELKQAESALPAAREQIVALQEIIQLTRNQLAALLGQGPDRGGAIARPGAHALATVVIPSRLPADLLGRRPDIVAQRWRIEAAQHDVRSAKAEFYPNINLSAIVGFQNLGPGTLLTAANREIGVGPALTLPIFDAGRRRANLAAKDASYDVAVEQYNQALADALRDVADQLASFRSVDAQRIEQQQAMATTQEAYDLAVLRYREGVGNYLQVLTTETELLAQRRLDVELRARSLDLSVGLLRALGGGFEDEAPAPKSRRGS